jgi:hypothetical protein
MIMSQFFITFPSRTLGRRIAARYRKMYWGVHSTCWQGFPNLDPRQFKNPL